jgi:hypothetical protein
MYSRSTAVAPAMGVRHDLIDIVLRDSFPHLKSFPCYGSNTATTRLPSIAPSTSESNEKEASGKTAFPLAAAREERSSSLCV